jgi:DNA-binding MarR family transcriptional regulator
MWSNVLQHVPPEGVRIRELHARARTTRDSLAGLQRWGYVTVDPVPIGGRGERPKEDLMVRATAAGKRAQEVWEPLAAEVEDRWRTRFGTDAIRSLRESLEAVGGRLDTELPDYLPVVYPTQNGRAEIPEVRAPASTVGGVDATTHPLDLSALLSQVLLTFTVDFERESKISLPISANTLRVLDETGVRVRDLPRLTGVSKEANSMSVGFLERHGCVVVEPDPSANRGRVVRLTTKGRKAQDKYRRVLDMTEQHWATRFGGEVVADLRGSLERLVGAGPGARRSVLMKGMEPYPEGWRALVRQPETLPHYPMVLHRGGYPDGS